MGNIQMAELAAQVKMGGHFDKIIPMVENMMLLLKKEEGEDVEHRDRCKNKARVNQNEIDDHTFEIDETDKKLKRMDDDKEEMQTTIENLEEAIQESNNTLNNGAEDR